MYNLPTLVLPHQEVAAVGGKNTSLKVGRKASIKQKESLPSTTAPLGKGKQSKLSSSGLNAKMGRGRAAKGQKAEPLVKEEGEMSDNEEVYEQFKEVKWMEWCEDVMVDEEKTLMRLEKLQSTSDDLPKDKVNLLNSARSLYLSPTLYLYSPNGSEFFLLLQVIAKIRNYLQLLGRRIDQIVLEYYPEPHRQESKPIMLSLFGLS